MIIYICVVVSISLIEWVILKENKIKFMILREIRVMGGGGGEIYVRYGGWIYCGIIFVWVFKIVKNICLVVIL